MVGSSEAAWVREGERDTRRHCLASGGRWRSAAGFRRHRLLTRLLRPHRHNPCLTSMAKVMGKREREAFRPLSEKDIDLLRDYLSGGPTWVGGWVRARCSAGHRRLSSLLLFRVSFERRLSCCLLCRSLCQSHSPPRRRHPGTGQEGARHGTGARAGHRAGAAHPLGPGGGQAGAAGGAGTAGAEAGRECGQVWQGSWVRVMQPATDLAVWG